MLTNTLTIINIDSVHSNAICEEIGYRLSQVLKIELAELPPYLAGLIDRFQRDEELAPPLVPSLDSMGLEENQNRHGALATIS
jgi:hypothetical protein